MSKNNSMSKALVRRETIAGYAFMLPSLIFFLGFVIYPMVQCVFTSFFDATMNREDIFVGFANYIELFQDKVFLGALKYGDHRGRFRASDLYFLLVGKFRHLRPCRSCLLGVSLYFLSSGRDGFCCRCRCVEVDVQQLLRHI